MSESKWVKSGQSALTKAKIHSNKQAKRSKKNRHQINDHNPKMSSHLNNWLGLDWQLSLFSGWGIAGLNISHEMEVDGRFRAVPLHASAELEHASDKFTTLIDKLKRREEEVAKVLGSREGGLVCEFPVIHSLGNALHDEDMYNPVKPLCRGSREFAIVFFEFNTPNDHTIRNANQFEILFGGSTWNTRLLRQHGLTNVDTFIQGVDLSLFRPVPREREERFVVYSGGKLEHRKGQDITVAAFREFVKTHPDAVLATTWHNQWPESMQGITLDNHVANVPQVDDAGNCDIARWISENGVPEKNIHDYGMVSNHLMPEVFAQADVAVFPNRCEGGTNLVAMEAMASGVPCILSANTGHLDLIENDNCYPIMNQAEVSRLSYAKDWGESSVDEIVELLNRVYTDKHEAKKRGEQAAKFMQDWSWEKRTKYLIDVMG